MVIAHFIYASGIGLAIALRYAFGPGEAAAPLGLVGPLLLAVAIVDYGISLWLERKILAGAGAVPANLDRRLTAAIITASFGASIAVYGIVLWFVGGGVRWWAVFVGLACLHWFHSFLRWSQSEENLSSG